ncbi:hypothetical protein [Paracoccus sulfuroxidans]|uniref:Uncharacterized protein n=1 Tax=Paracoccus sulfuroxidans TaxID=384678 RepID=A0A562NC16_9RHOB|nr:hypothetical protein [Paracoccus sulfuroxidans]TWI29664.1 hypothetical protein IQ24_03479 [Paracoccus sulfuroxidans]
MKLNKSYLAIAAVVGLAGLAACDKTAPAVPEPTPGPIASSSSLNGTYNLLESQCDNPTSDKSLVIDGNKFIFPGSTCTVASTSSKVNQTEVTLSCDQGGNRVVLLQSREKLLRLTEQTTTLNYFQCSKAQASTDSLVGQTL